MPTDASVQHRHPAQATSAEPPAIDMVVPWPVREWAPHVTADEAVAMRAALERGNVLHFPIWIFRSMRASSAFSTRAGLTAKPRTSTCAPTRPPCAARWANRQTWLISQR